MSVFAIGVDEPHSTLSTIPLRLGGRDEGRRGVRGEVDQDGAAVTGELVHLEQLRGHIGDRQVGREDLDRNVAQPCAMRAGTPSAYAEIVSGEAIGDLLSAGLDQGLRSADVAVARA